MTIGQQMDALIEAAREEELPPGIISELENLGAAVAQDEDKPSLVRQLGKAAEKLEPYAGLGAQLARVAGAILG